MGANHNILRSSSATPQDENKPPSAGTLRGEVICAGVDWLTCTVPRSREFEHFRELGMSLVDEEAAQGNDTRRYKSQGYHGWASGGASCGTRYDTHIIQMRSDLARERWRDAGAIAQNISRLDLQYTIELSRRQPDVIMKTYMNLRGARSVGGRRASLRLITSKDDGDTVYCGKRSSDRFGRWYDKGAEDKSASKGKVLRYEMQTARASAKLHAAEMMESTSDTATAIQFVSTYFSKRGLPSGIAPAQYREVLTSRVTDDMRRLRWLQSGVAPSIKVLRAHNRLYEAIHALELCDILDPNCQTCASARKEG